MQEYDKSSKDISGRSSGKNKVPELLEKAESVARGVLESVQALAGTSYCKGIQCKELKEWAKSNSCWIENNSCLGVFSDRGSENEVYLNIEKLLVYKLNDFRYSDDNLQPFFDRIKAHNFYFPDCKYDFIGISENQEGKICAVLSQPFVLAAREATDVEIRDALFEIGFSNEEDNECFTNGEYDIYDALPNNVLVGYNGKLYFIDPIIFISQTNNGERYRSLSPRFSTDKQQKG